MAQPTNTFDSYDSVGNHEDLANIIYNLSPMDTPLLSNAGRTKATATLHEWQTDVLAAAANNAQIEGDDSTGTAVAPTVRVFNSTQISTKVPVVSRTQRVVDAAGRKDELSYQVAKAAKELKRDMEKALLDNQARVVGSSVLARRLRGLPVWYSSNSSVGVGGANGSDLVARTDGAPRVFTEALLTPVIQSIWTNGGDPDIIMLGSFNKAAMKSFAGASTERFSEVSKKVITASVDIYESDFGGELKIVPNRFQRSRDCHIIQSDMLSIAYLDDFQIQELAKTGDNEKRLLVTEYTLRNNNEAAHGIVADLTVA